MKAGLGALIALTFATPLYAAAPPPPPPTEIQGLHLGCDGTASWIQKVTDDNGTIGVLKDDTETKHARSAAGRVQVRFSETGGAFRLPPTFPGRTEVWTPFYGVELRGELIVGSLKGLFGLSDAASIDRQSGEAVFRLRDLTFSGVCEKIVETPGVRRF